MSMIIAECKIVFEKFFEEYNNPHVKEEDKDDFETRYKS